MRLFIGIIMLISLSQTSEGQTIQANLFDKMSNEPLILGTTYLISYSNNDTLSLQGDFSGKFYFKNVSPGIYFLKISPIIGYHEVFKDSIILGKTDSIELNLYASQCKADYQIKPCPKGKSKRKVVRVMYNLRVDLNFDNDRAFERSSKKLRKQGYRTTELKGDEVLIYIHDTKLHTVLKDSSICDRYLFCKKHKILFK